MAGDLLKIQTVNVVQPVVALGSLRKKENKIGIIQSLESVSVCKRRRYLNIFNGEMRIFDWKGIHFFWPDRRVNLCFELDCPDYHDHSLSVLIANHLILDSLRSVKDLERIMELCHRQMGEVTERGITHFHPGFTLIFTSRFFWFLRTPLLPNHRLLLASLGSKTIKMDGQ